MPMPTAAIKVAITLASIWTISAFFGHRCLFSEGCLFLSVVAFGWWIREVSERLK